MTTKSKHTAAVRAVRDELRDDGYEFVDEFPIPGVNPHLCCQKPGGVSTTRSRRYIWVVAKTGRRNATGDISVPANVIRQMYEAEFCDFEAMAFIYFVDDRDGGVYAHNLKSILAQVFTERKPIFIAVDPGTKVFTIPNKALAAVRANRTTRQRDLLLH